MYIRDIWAPNVNFLLLLFDSWFDSHRQIIMCWHGLYNLKFRPQGYFTQSAINVKSRYKKYHAILNVFSQSATIYILSHNIWIKSLLFQSEISRDKAIYRVALYANGIISDGGPTLHQDWANITITWFKRPLSYFTSPHQCITAHHHSSPRRKPMVVVDMNGC